MNTVFGPVFNASRAEAATPGMAEDRARKLAGQFIFDCQTHFVRDDYGQVGITGLAQFAKQFWNPALANEKSLDRMKFANYVKEIYVDSDTKVAHVVGLAGRRSVQPVPDQRPDHRGAHRGQFDRAARAACWRIPSSSP